MYFSIAFSGYSVMWGRERKWALDQKIEETKDGLILSFTSTQYDKVVAWVLSRGASAKPLEPKVLVDEWKGCIRKMGELSGVFDNPREKI
jgi:hypothetical protein